MKSVLNVLCVYWLSLLFVALDIALLATLYGSLPDPVPMLWNGDGEVTRWMAKPMGALLLPLAQLAITLFLIAAPAVDPGALRAPAAPRFYRLAVAIISGFLTLATSTVFAAALGVSISVPHTMFVGIGVLLALVGNYLGKVPKNYMVGIRTPWTIASEHIWERTHRFAAPLFVAGGIALILLCILQRDSLNLYIAGAILMATAIAPYCYSYMAWRRTGYANVNPDTPARREPFDDKR